MIDCYNTIDGEFSVTKIIEKSKFICYLKSVDNEEQAKEFILRIKKQNSLATHNCYAYIADENGLVMKFSDDGEPQGTAGLPMLEVLKNKKIHKVVAVVTRYFGGIKLGTGGLTRAYSGSVSSCLEQTSIVVKRLAVLCNLTCNYENYPKLKKVLDNINVCMLDTFFNNDITLTFAVKSDYLSKLKDNLSNLFKGNYALLENGIGYYPFGDICQK